MNTQVRPGPEHVRILQSESGMCRMCTTEARPVISLNEIVEDISLVAMLRYCASLMIDEFDGFPYQCCSDCKGNLLVAYKLKKKVQHSDEWFRSQSHKDEGKRWNALEEDEQHFVDETVKNEFLEDCEPNVVSVYAETSFATDPELKPSIKEEFLSEKTNESYKKDDSREQSDGSESNAFKPEIESDDDDDDVPVAKLVRRGRKRAPGGVVKRCCQCKITLSSMAEALQHAQDTHLDAKCTDPDKILLRPYECQICFKRYSSTKVFYRHTNLLYLDNQFKCDECEECFNNETKLLKHKQKHGKEVVQLYSKRKGQLPRCCACFKQFETEKILKEHAEMVHKPENLLSTDKDNKYQCDLCFRRYKNLRILKDHHLKPYRLQQYQCSVCGKIFRDKNCVADHERTHNNERAYVCPICDKAFMMKDTFRKHVRSHSIAEDRFKCEVCGKGFKEKSNLKDHMITHNPHHRPILCAVCPATFARKSCLQAHMKQHTGEKPYKCDQCDAAYAFSTDLKRHIMAHQGIKPYLCTICGRGYPRKDYLRKHMANHNNQG
ncbi:zinc finger protein 883-like [Uranotaenia lowii]|uniref:zinc finger protein 883-like n=1 Tax=Uranotaenia lowii TaxID=190385 RepID=UPI002478886E|nr:zinc finger protein 883-like [Uranotaenia lowii]